MHVQREKLAFLSFAAFISVFVGARPRLLIVCYYLCVHTCKFLRRAYININDALCNIILTTRRSTFFFLFLIKNFSLDEDRPRRLLCPSRLQSMYRPRYT